MGTQIKDEPCHQVKYGGPPATVTLPPNPDSTARFKPAFTKGNEPAFTKGNEPDSDFEPGYSAQRAALHELVQKMQREQEAMQDNLVLNALGMTREEAIANKHRITRHCHPSKDVFLLDGEPVVEIHKPDNRGDELITTYRVMRKLP